MRNYWNIVTFLFFQLKVPTSDKPEVTVNFRKLLLNRCQKEFEKDKDDDEIFEQKQKELDAATEVTSCHICKQSTVYSVWNSSVEIKIVLFLPLGWGASAPEGWAGGSQEQGT